MKYAVAVFFHQYLLYCSMLILMYSQCCSLGQIAVISHISEVIKQNTAVIIDFLRLNCSHCAQRIYAATGLVPRGVAPPALTGLHL
jgi:hypothetical protein